MHYTVNTLVVAVAAACGASDTRPTPLASRASSARDASLAVGDRCEMIEAAFRLDSFRRFACGDAATKDHRILVDVDMEPRFAPGEKCTSGVFAIYRGGELTNTDAVLRITVWSHDARTWEFGATYFDPPNSPDDHLSDGGFDDANYYCAFIGGRLARSGSGWRAWIAPMQ